jgi:MFS family permease
MLLAVSIFNFVDRQILAILIEPIRAEFHLSDTQVGFLAGIAFAVFYTVFGIPLAKLADSGNRSNLICAVMMAWSFLTTCCGLAAGFASLVLARIGVAVGEAGSGPASQSMLSDYFPPDRRVTVFGILSVGVYIGILIGFLLGGWINEFFGWRTAFFVVGVPGVLFTVLFWLTVKEPLRGGLDGILDPGSAPHLWTTIKHLWRVPAYRHMPFAIGFYTFVAYGSMTWTPSFFIRTHGMTTGQIGTWLALSVGVAGGAGCYFGAVLTDWLANRSGDKRWYVWVPAGTITLSIPFLLGVYLWPTPVPALLMSVLAWFFGNAWLGPALATIQGLAPLRMRAMALATVLCVNNIIGLGLGPQLVGILSDAFKSRYGDGSLRYSLVLCLIGASILSVFHFLRAARTIRNDLAHVGSGQLTQSPLGAP